MNSNISSSQFKYETRVKNKPNAQGTLFQASPEARTPASRQPRGYSKERYKEVTEAADIQVKNTRGQSWMGHAHGGTRMMTYKGHAGTLAKAAASLARSTVPVSDIKRPHPDLKPSVDNPDLHVGVVPSNGGTDPLGEYHHAASTANKTYAALHLYNDKADDGTVLHELGHHVDRDHPYQTPADQGRAEGFAEAYEQKHARTAGYKKKTTVVESKPSKWQGYNGRELNPYQFDEAFYSQHPREGAGPKMNSKEEILSRPGIPKGHVIGQQPLLHRNTSYDGTKARWTYNEDLNK